MFSCMVKFKNNSKITKDVEMGRINSLGHLFSVISKLKLQTNEGAIYDWKSLKLCQKNRLFQDCWHVTWLSIILIYIIPITRLINWYLICFEWFRRKKWECITKVDATKSSTCIHLHRLQWCGIWNHCCCLSCLHYAKIK